MKELEARFGKPALVVKVTLDRLRKTSRIQNDIPHEVRNLSDAVSTTVWIFKRFGCINDPAAVANISTAVDKLSPDLQVKWKDHVRTSNLHQPNLEDFCSWLKGKADIYDDCFKFHSETAMDVLVKSTIPSLVTSHHVTSKQNLA